MEISAFRPSRATAAPAPGRPGPTAESRAWHWLDLAWGLALIATSASGAAFLLLAYPVALACLRRGGREGAAVALAAVAGTLLIAALEHAHAGPWHPLLPGMLSLGMLGGAILLPARVERAQQARLRRLTDSAADGERRRISLDLHDGAIQPYLGLKLGLEALRRKVEPGNPLAQDVDELCRVTQESIAELRGYVRVLRGAAPPPGALEQGLRRQIARFQRFYGFKTELKLAPGLQLDAALAGEVVQMVGEGLSNIGRHTVARQVAVSVSGAAGRLVVDIVNQGGGAPWRSFTPASLVQRAGRLGGLVEVAPRGDGSLVRIVIPS